MMRLVKNINLPHFLGEQMESNATKEQIRRARRLLGLTQQTMADELGVSLRTYQRYEDGTLQIPKKIYDLLQYKMPISDDAPRKKRTKPITRRINTAKDPALKKEILLDWAINWANEHRGIVNDIGRANADDDYDTMCKKIGELREVSERKFQALIRVIGDNFFSIQTPADNAHPLASESESNGQPSPPPDDDGWENQRQVSGTLTQSS